MKNIVNISLLVIVAIWSASANASDINSKMTTGTAQKQVSISYDEFQLGSSEAEKILAKDFEKAWLSVGKDLGYPKISTTDIQNSVGKNINIKYVEDKWLLTDWEAWNTYDNKLKFYMVGFFTKFKVGENKKLTAEEFKSHAMGYYQCVNAVTNVQKFFRDNRSNLTGSVESTFQTCGIARVQF